MRPTNHERDALIVELIDKKKKTMKATAELLRMAVSSVHEAYYRTKNKAIRLSTVK